MNTKGRELLRDKRRAVGVAAVVVLVAGVILLVVRTQTSDHGARGTSSGSGGSSTAPGPPASSSTESAGGPPAATTRVHGPVHTEGTQIVDASGQVVRLLGVDDGRLEQCTPSVPPESEADNIANAGFNTVRLAVSWAAIEPVAPQRDATGAFVHQWSEPYLMLVDQAVQRFTSRGIAVVLDLHQVNMSPVFAPAGARCDDVGLPGWLFDGIDRRDNAVCMFFGNGATPSGFLPWDGLREVWAQLASRYAQDPLMIGADVYNEPYVVDPCPNIQRDRLADLYQHVGEGIRAVDPSLTLFLEDVAYSAYQRAGLQLDRLPDLPNVVYSWHFYPTTWAEGEPGLAAHLQASQRFGVPLWIGEFDAFGGASNVGRRSNPNWQEDLREMMTYCRDNGVSWTLWEYRGRGSSLLELGNDRMKPDLVMGLQTGL